MIIIIIISDCMFTMFTKVFTATCLQVKLMFIPHGKDLSMQDACLAEYFCHAVTNKIRLECT